MKSRLTELALVIVGLLAILAAAWGWLAWMNGGQY